MKRELSQVFDGRASDPIHLNNLTYRDFSMKRYDRAPARSQSPDDVDQIEFSPIEAEEQKVNNVSPLTDLESGRRDLQSDSLKQDGTHMTAYSNNLFHLQAKMTASKKTSSDQFVSFKNEDDNKSFATANQDEALSEGTQMEKKASFHQELDKNHTINFVHSKS